jgi:hypothetical protein
LLHDEGRLLPSGRVQRQPFWKRQRVGHSILPCRRNGPPAGASAAVVIAKNPAKDQCLMNGIPLRVILTRYPLNNYYRYDKARFQIAFLFRDAKQFTGLCDGQARSQAKLDLHFNASLTAVTRAKLEARQQNGGAGSSFSMASLKRRAFNQHLIDRMCDQLAKGHSLEKSSPAYEDLCNYGSITELAA